MELPKYEKKGKKKLSCMDTAETYAALKINELEL